MSKSINKLWRQGEPAEGAGLWYGKEMSEKKQDWTHLLTPEDLEEVARALAHVKQLGFQKADDMPDSLEVFPLNSLARKLEDIRKELEQGPGFALLRGLPVEQYDLDTAGLVFKGLNVYLGQCVSQNHKGELVSQVIDRSDEITDPRRYQAGGEFRMHVDPIDIVGLMCMRKARAGGESKIVSALAVHNEMLGQYPEYLQKLYDGYRLYRPYPDRGETPPLTAGKVPFFASDAAGSFTSFFLPDPAMQASQREKIELMRLEREALDFAESVAARDHLVLEMNLLPGDIQLLNNRKVLHSRASYEDFPEKERRRLMLRMWIMVPEWTAMSPLHKFFDNTDKLGGGISPSS